MGHENGVIWRKRFNGKEVEITYSQLKKYKLLHPNLSNLQAIKELINIKLKEINFNRGSNNYFEIAGDLENNQKNDKSTSIYWRESPSLSEQNDDIILELINSDNAMKDLKIIEDFINLKKTRNDTKGEQFLYNNISGFVKLDVPIEDFINKMAIMLGISKFDISGNKMGINGFAKLNDYDYRISFENSENLNLSDIMYFFYKFNERAKKDNLDYGLKFEPNVSDLIILYIKNDNLQKVLNILESLKTSDVKMDYITSNFGKQKPFSSSVNNNSFYGVSMGTSRIVGNNFKGYFALGSTFTEYSGSLLDKAYEILFNKYKGDISKINSLEFYEIMQKIHKDNYGFSYDDNLPLWMNADNFNYINKELDKNNYIK